MRTRRLVLGVLLLAPISLGLAWWIGRDDGGESPAVAGERTAPEPGPERPMLVGAPRAEPAPAKDRANVPKAAEARGTVEGATSRSSLDLRVVDERGEPLARRRVSLTTESEVKEARTDGEGRLIDEVARADLKRVELWGAAGSALLLLETADELSRLGQGTLIVQGLVHFVLRTVDSRRDVRPDHRFLYRLESTHGFWGETTDKQGLRRLGPFRSGTRLQLRPGPRGEKDLFTKTDWRTVVVDGSPVDLVVGELPRLRLRVRGVPPDEEIPIAVLDREDGNPLFPRTTSQFAGVWTAPALSLGVVEVLVGPTGDGRFARREVVVQEDPIDVELGAGLPLTGRLSAPGLRTPLKGIVHVSGRGFFLRFVLGDDGTFRLPGVPDESMSFDAVALSEDGTVYLGRFERRDERDITIPVAAGVRLAGRVVPVDAKGTPRDGVTLVLAEIRSVSPTLTAPPTSAADGAGRFSLVLPAGRWRLEVTAYAKTGTFVGSLELGEVAAPREDLVIHLTSAR